MTTDLDAVLGFLAGHLPKIPIYDAHWLRRIAEKHNAPPGIPDCRGMVSTASFCDLAPRLRATTRERIAELRSHQLAGRSRSQIDAWRQKLLRVCELRMPGLAQYIGTQPGRHCLEEKALELCLLFMEAFADTNDVRFVNVVLKMLDSSCIRAKHRTVHARPRRSGQRPGRSVLLRCLLELYLQDALSDIRTASRDFATRPSAQATEACLEEIDSWSSAEKPCDVVVLSPSRFSLYTIVVMEMLQRRGVRVKGVVVRKLLVPARFLKEWRRDGVRLLRKIWKKLFLRKKAYKPADYLTMQDLFDRLGIDDGSVDAIARRYACPVRYCKTLNDPTVHGFLESSAPDMVVFTGGGLIRDQTLARSGSGILNCHMGQLPAYRGMDVVEWPLIENHPNQVGFTTHFMDAGIDTGDIAQVFSVPLTRNDATISDLRTRMEPLMAHGIVSTVVSLRNGQIHATPQSARDGRLFFIAHPTLYKIAENRLALHSGNSERS